MPRSFFAIQYSISKLGATISAVITKNTTQSPSKLSTSQPLPPANKVRPKFPSEAISAYCEALYVRLVRCEMNATKATVENAEVKLSRKIAVANTAVSGPVAAM